VVEVGVAKVAVADAETGVTKLEVVEVGEAVNRYRKRRELLYGFLLQNGR
jgi:hypothetical protein